MDKGFSDRHDAWHGTFDGRMLLACLDRSQRSVEPATGSMLPAAALRREDEDHGGRRGEKVKKKKKKNRLAFVAVWFGPSRCLQSGMQASVGIGLVSAPPFLTQLWPRGLHGRSQRHVSRLSTRVAA
ncbi:hypothetical protein DTO271G3_2019 [Paecilomyces variotii]|nr:hypothetical protein DTO271G3_2019 [Paecilomyces variotii]